MNIKLIHYDSSGKVLNYFLFHDTRFISQGWNIDTIQQLYRKGFVMERFVLRDVPGCLCFGAGGAHFFCPFWQLDNNLFSRFSFSKFCPDERESNTLLEVSCSMRAVRESRLTPMQKIRMYINRSQGASLALQSTHQTVPIPFLAAPRRQGSRSSQLTQEKPIWPSELSTQVCGVGGFCPMLGFKQDSHNWPLGATGI